MGKCRHCGDNAGFGLEVCRDCNEKIYMNDEPVAEKKKEKIVIRKYKGKQDLAFEKFKSDAESMERLGYAPISQSWAPGSYGCGAFLLALLLCFLIIGILVFVYMLIVKPDGTLTVTYELREQATASSTQPISTHKANEKMCPMCAETVKAAAKICRYCNHVFEEAKV